MREIKFIAWDLVNLEMVEVLEIDFGERCLTVMSNKYDEVQCRFLRDFKLMQYTGLKDKNGIEVFEGDVIEETDEELLTIAQVKWNQKSAMFELHECRLPLIGSDDGEALGCKVVGNIYENPELLKQ